jgi:two-component system, NtrC family, response regulator HydG
MTDPATTMMLISGDPTLVESCQGLVDSFPALRLHVMSQAQEAEGNLARDEIKLILVHLVQERETRDVVRLLHCLATLKRSVPLLVLSEQYDADQAWSLTRLGATDYLSLPLDRERLASFISPLAMQVQPANPGSAIPERVELGKGMDVMMEQVRLVASQNTTIMLGGETGTGKTRLARLIHECSPRRAEPFLVINCGALVTELIESEMFGHVKGAFTGAERARVGKFAAAGQGTLLLDEIDALPLALQAKLLRAVEERIFEPVGSNSSVPVEARLIAASNRPLESEVEAGQFRADLYYRLNVVSFHLPPLREQPERISLLATNFLKDCASRNGRPVYGITANALRMLEAYHWPGNIRELRNVIERAVALCPNHDVGLGDLPEALCSAVSSSTPPSCQPVQGDGPAWRSAIRHAQGKAEIALIMEALRNNGNNRLRAALELGISRRTLYKKLHRYGLMETGVTPTDWCSTKLLQRFPLALATSSGNNIKSKLG